MKRAVLLIFLSALPLFAQEVSCIEDRFSPQWIAFPDYSQEFYRHSALGSKQMKAYNFSKMKPHLNVALNWTKELAADIKRSKEAKYKFEMYYGPGSPEELFTNVWYLATGRNGGYTLRIKLHDIFCRSNRMGTVDGPAEILISFNSLHKLAESITTYDESGTSVPLEINGKPVFLVPELKKSEDNQDFYEFPGPVPEYVVNYGRWEFIDAFVIRNSRKPLFIPVTRKEFLENYLTEIDKTYHVEKKFILESMPIKPPEEIEREREARIAEIKKFTEQGAYGYATSDYEHRIKTANEFFNNKKSEEADKIKNLSKELDENFAESVRLIKEYLMNNPPAVLGKSFRKVPATFTNPQSVKRMLENLDDAPNMRMWGQNTEICFINRDYFDNTLPNDVPQVIVIEFVNNEYLHENLKILVKRIYEKNDFSKLSELLRQ